MLIAVARREGEIAGIAPLMLVKTRLRGLPVSLLQFMGNDDSPRCDFIIRRGGKGGRGEKGILEDIFQALRRQKWDVLRLENVEQASPGVGYLQTAGFKYCVDTKLNSPWISLNQDWESFFNTLSPKSRKTIRNVVNRVQRLGEVEVAEFKDAAGMEFMEQVSRRAWKYAAGRSYLNNTLRKSFFQKLSAAAQERGWLSVWGLKVDGQAVACEYHLRYAGSSVSLIAEFDEAYHKHSPGAALDFYIIQRLFKKNGGGEYIMGGVLDEYKKKWQPEVRIQNDYYVFTDSLYSRLLYGIEAGLVTNYRKIKLQAGKQCQAA